MFKGIRRKIKNKGMKTDFQNNAYKECAMLVYIPRCNTQKLLLMPD